ncbi:hypothetical protein FRC07_003114 [Ceratobasidium sp. 392]|nr:hypothetical protein FRC07_003114 [Ceratobasidium sp. 392]
MILDTENSDAKSSGHSNSDTQTRSLASVTHLSFRSSNGSASYSTFPASDSPGQYTNAVSDITALLGNRSPEFLSGDEQPPAYEDVGPARKTGNRFWARCAAIVLTLFLLLSSLASYRLSKRVTPIPEPPSPNRPPPGTSSTLPFHTSTSVPSSVSSMPPLPPLPPYDPLPGPPNLPYVLPITGRTDLCRPWAYSPNSGAHPSYSDKRPTDHLTYTIPSLAPIRIETSMICFGTNDHHKRCSEYDGLDDAFSGKLQVVGGDVDLPKVELFLQHDSELGLEDVSICLMQQPLAADEPSVRGEKQKWVLGIYIWRDPTSPARNHLLASASIMLTLPYQHTHDLTTRLRYLSQTIGCSSKTMSRLLSFGTLRLGGSHNQIAVRNIEAETIEGVSDDSPLSVADSRVNKSLNLQSTYGVVDAVVDLEYPLVPTINPPQFSIVAYSRFSRATLWVTDQKGTDALRTSHIPSVLPTIRMNLTSQYAIAQVIAPATYHGSVDLKSHYARTGAIDHAEHLPGRAIEWLDRGDSTRGNVRWDGVQRGDEGRIYVATEFATSRLLFFGLEDGSLENWPKESNGMEFGRDAMASSLVW